MIPHHPLPQHHSSFLRGPPACLSSVKTKKKSFLVQINSGCPRWEDLLIQDEFQCLPEPLVGKDIDDWIAGRVEVSKPDKDVKDQWWCDEVKEAVHQCVDGKGKPAQEINAHSNAQGLGGFSFTLGSLSQAFAEGTDLLDLPGSNHEDLYVQTDHDQAGEKEHGEV